MFIKKAVFLLVAMLFVVITMVGATNATEDRVNAGGGVSLQPSGKPDAKGRWQKIEVLESDGTKSTISPGPFGFYFQFGGSIVGAAEYEDIIPELPGKELAVWSVVGLGASGENPDYYNLTCDKNAGKCSYWVRIYSKNVKAKKFEPVIMVVTGPNDYRSNPGKKILSSAVAQFGTDLKVFKGFEASLKKGDFKKASKYFQGGFADQASLKKIKICDKGWYRYHFYDGYGIFRLKGCKDELGEIGIRNGEIASGFEETTPWFNGQ